MIIDPKNFPHLSIEEIVIKAEAITNEYDRSFLKADINDDCSKSLELLLKIIESRIINELSEVINLGCLIK